MTKCCLKRLKLRRNVHRYAVHLSKLLPSRQSFYQLVNPYRRFSTTRVTQSSLIFLLRLEIDSASSAQHIASKSQQKDMHKVVFENSCFAEVYSKGGI